MSNVVNNIGAKGAGSLVRLSTVDQLYQQLRKEIIGNDLSPGTRLSEMEIAQIHGVSRQPVREAFIKLANEGLLDVRAQRGSFVAKISLPAVMDARFVREAVEADIIKLLAQAPDASLIRELRRQITHQKDLIGGSARDFMMADEEFHRSLAEGADKANAWRVIEEMKAQMDRVRFLSSMHFSVERLVYQHKDIVDAIEEGNAQQGEASIRAHLRGILNDLYVIEAEQPDYFL